ncbi:MAG: hypothetical protein ABJ004_15315, partial [Cyclobacteriaceae bacterium]
SKQRHCMTQRKRVGLGKQMGNTHSARYTIVVAHIFYTHFFVPLLYEHCRSENIEQLPWSLRTA